MTAPGPAQYAEYESWLKHRAESYWRDAVNLREDGDNAMAVAYETIAHELRACAKEVGQC